MSVAFDMPSRTGDIRTPPEWFTASSSGDEIPHRVQTFSTFDRRINDCGEFAGLNNDAGSDGASFFANSADTSPNSPVEFSEPHPATHTTKNKTPHEFRNTRIAAQSTTRVSSFRTNESQRSTARAGRRSDLIENDSE